MSSLIQTDIILNNPIPWRAAIEPLNFSKRSCTTFIPKETNKECCVCNYTHPKSDVPHTNEIWNCKMHTKQEVTDCYGILPQSTSPYLRCDVETDLEQLCFVLLGVWYMANPDLIMRMIGDIDTTPNIKIEKELLQSISDAAVASDAWIITNGYKEESISESVGEVMYNCRMNNSHINFSAIAVGKWGNIHNCHKIDERNPNTPFTIHKGHGRYKLELNHTEYVFFDDGTCDSLDTGEFASNFAFSSAGCEPLADILYKYLKLTLGSYKSSKSDDQDETFTDSEDDLDIATINEIFEEVSDDVETEASSTKKPLKEMLRSLGKFRLNFVNDVRKLYNIVRQQNYETQARDSLSHTKKKYHKTIDEQLHLALRWSIGDTIEHQSATTTKIWNDTNKLLANEEKDLVIVLQKPAGDFMLPLYDTQSDDDKENIDAEHIYRDLFLWCILTYRLDMAKIFLSQLKTRICSALIASKILKSLAAYAPDQAAKDTLFAKANDFETHAIEFVRCAYCNDKHKACELIM
ncbi:unnamed protein product [Adineta steineri]|uniref:Uncharacterized protein n=1 Tax=Adineta steineri TaxID=433720 RepID=A0A814CL86_9BILA|nr:unnamed protein product [Adineta steineri]CAF4060370.1 unnamed protein product [Adineta steineri]